MKNVTNKLIFTLLCMTFPACSVVQPRPDNKPVRLVFYNEINLVSKDAEITCKYLGPLISSEGRWYSYLFTSNTKLANGAINDMYNKANELGANIVYINGNIDFSTSVTLLGQAYQCP